MGFLLGILVFLGLGGTVFLLVSPCIQFNEWGTGGDPKLDPTPVCPRFYLMLTLQSAPPMCVYDRTPLHLRAQ